MKKAISSLDSVLRCSIDSSATRTVEGVIKKLKHRNKILQIADSFPGGWDGA